VLRTAASDLGWQAESPDESGADYIEKQPDAVDKR
jgi:hypothetical protein